MNLDKKLEKLKQITPVDAPPFLFTRIREQLPARISVDASAQWKWTFAATAVVILVLNTAIALKSTDAKKDSGLQDLISHMHLSSSNNLYDE